MKHFGNWLVEIRLYALEDRLPLIETINAVCAEGRWMETLRYEPTPAWEHALAAPDCLCHLLLVVCDQHGLVGWCRVFPTDTVGEARVGIGLQPMYRGQGLGTRMLQQAIDWARRQNLVRLTLSTRLDNEHAICLFRKHGFTQVGRGEEGWIQKQHILTPHCTEARRQSL